MHQLGEKRPSSPSQTNQRWEDQSKSLETVVSAKGENPPGGNREEPPSRKERRQEKNPLVERKQARKPTSWDATAIGPSEERDEREV